MKNKTKMFTLTASSLLFLTGCNKLIEHTQAINSPELVETIDRTNLIRLSAVGDVMVHGPQLQAQLKDDNSYDFKNNFKYIKPIIESSEIAFANLETTINQNRNVSSYPCFNSPIEILEALEDCGFDILSTINNHSLDTSKSGVFSTLNEISNFNLTPVGTQLNEDDLNYTIKDINNIKLGISAFSYSDMTSSETYLNGIPSYGIKNNLNTIPSNNVNKSFDIIKKEIDLMKQDGAEFIIIMLHWGEEYRQNPNTYQKQLAQMLVNEGVDLILGSHPHVVQPIETLKSPDNNHEGLVIYSMGNIISNQREEAMGFSESENGIIPIIDIKKDESGDTYIDNIQYIPTWVNKFRDANNNVNYEIVPLNEDLEVASTKYNASINDLTKSLENTMNVIGENIAIYKGN